MYITVQILRQSWFKFEKSYYNKFVTVFLGIMEYLYYIRRHPVQWLPQLTLFFGISNLIRDRNID